jgi:8-amino-7-oxononanoate synthase
MTPGESSDIPLMQSPPGPYTVIDGRRSLYFVGTGYLGLQDNPQIIEALCDGAREYGINSATSRAGLGNTPPVVEVERLSGEFFDRDDAFYFPTGYAGNYILISVLAGQVDAAFTDEHAYFCLREAVPLLGCPVHTFRHADPADMRNTLRKHLLAKERPLVLSDGVFGGNGEIAPVADYASILAEYPGAVLMLDDAHGVGVLGENGRGTFEHAGMFNRVNVGGTARGGGDDGLRLMFNATLSKAIGGYGGIVPGSRTFVQRAKTACRWFDCASAPPAPIAAATARALQLVMAHPEYRSRLSENVCCLRAGLRRLGLTINDSPVPIIELKIGVAGNMQRIQAGLQERGIIVAYRGARFVAGSEGAIRVAVFATHTQEMIAEFLDALRTLI